MTKNSPNLEEKQINGLDCLFKIIIIIIFFFQKYNVCTIFRYQVYINRLKNKISGLDTHISIRGGVPPSRADLRFFKDINLKFLYNILDVKTFPKKYIY